jgi:thiol:disulfide interchange protein DsbD
VALGLALLGGLLLNLMPCVFPVLSLKVVGFATQAHDRRALLAGGVAYTGGVVASFVALAGLLLALRAGGEHLGWGFQLQSPVVVVALAALFTAIGLNLAGLFEFGSVLPGSLAAARARHPVVDSALSGVLAVAIASPCTAPFMGASLGFALTLPTSQALSVFAALGLGMALPYLAASAWPGLARALPRPGAWMVTFKAVMAFPMFATVVWLAWVLGLQVGSDGVIALLGALLALAFALWAWGRPGASAQGRVMGVGAALLLLAIVLPWAWPAWQEPAAPVAAAGSATATTSGGAAPVAGAQGPGSAAAAPMTWQAWSQQKVADALASGRPVFIDFTAAWCVTCQFNKRTTLGDERVLQAFKARNVLLLRADWTRRDPAITQALQRLGRSGVPVYLLQAPGGQPPRLLGEVLSVDEVLQALDALR